MTVDPPSSTDRDPVAVPVDINSIDDPSLVEPGFGAGSTPEQILEGEVLQPEASDATIDAYSTSEYTGDHLAVVYPEVVNEPTTDGSWTELPSDPVPEAYGWRLESSSYSVKLPAALSSEHPVRFQIASGEFTSVPNGLTSPVPGTLEGSSVTYPTALPDTDFVYSKAPGGYKEEAIQWSPSAPLSLSWRFEAPGFTLTPLPTGVTEIRDGVGTLVARLGTPVVYDSSERPKQTPAPYSITQDAPGVYTLGLAIDPAWAQGATYPLTVDPGTTQPAPSDDSYVNSATGKKNTNYGSASTLEVGPSYRTFIKFPTAWHNPDRIIYEAKIWLYNTYEGNNDDLTAERVMGGWTNAGITWSNQPGTDPTPPIQNFNGAENSWWKIPVGNLYQSYNDGTWGDQGVRFASTGRKTFNSSAATSNTPSLFISYNDPPNQPFAQAPSDGWTLRSLTPTLSIQGLPNDANGDDVLVRYWVTDTQGVWTGGAAQNSGWINEDSFTVPGGWLTDGTQYWWKAEAADVCTPPTGLCDNVDAKGVTHPWQATPPRSFSVALKHNGTDERWAMWNQSIGNGMALNVNESNGNVFLEVPLDQIPTPIGNLHLGLSYNSQGDVNETDKGLGKGWNLHAGPSSSGTNLPIELIAQTPAPWAGVKVKYASGRVEEYPYRSGGGSGPAQFAPIGAGSGVITKNGSGGYTYRGPEGDEFTFDAAGALKEAHPVSSKAKSSAAQDGFYSYGYSAAGDLTSVTDPLGRVVTIAWTTQGSRKRPTSITYRSHTWTLTYANNTLQSVLTPANETLRFYQAPFCDAGNGNTESLLSEVRNGQQTSGAKPGWQIDYTRSGATNYIGCRATSLRPPQLSTTSAEWKFAYAAGGAGWKGYSSLATYVTDPRGVATQTAGDYRTEVQFNWAGLPIWIKAPKADPSSEPDWVTTMTWDTHNNLVCQASPAANAQRAQTNAGEPACSATRLNDRLATHYDYDTKEPYQLLSVTQPASADDANETRVATDYLHDEGPTFEGLWSERFENPNLAGVPAYEGMWADLNQSWTASQAPGGITSADNWSVRLFGALDVAAPTGGEKYEFRVTADDGVTMTLNNKVLLDCFGHNAGQEVNCGQTQKVTMVLFPGERPMTIEFADRGGAAKLKVEWKTFSAPDTAYQVISPADMLPKLELLTSKLLKPGTTALKLETTYGFAGDTSKMTRLPTFKTQTNFLTGTDAFHRRTEFTYDDFGRRKTTTKYADTAQAATWHRFYTDDAAGGSCLTRTLDPIGAEVTYSCNAYGDVTTQTISIRDVSIPATGETLPVADTRTTTNTYDAVGRLKQSDIPGPGVLEYSYDDAGRTIEQRELISGTDWATTAFLYQDHLAGGPRITETLPDPDLSAAGGNGPIGPATITHVYDWVGNEIQKIDPRGSTWTTTYDAQNRVTISQTPDPDGGSGPNLALATTTAYSVLPNEVTVTGPEGVPSTTRYDFLGRISREQVGTRTPTIYAYDAANHLVRTSTGPGGTSISTWSETEYDAFGRMTETRAPYRAGGATSTATTTYRYDAQTGLRTAVNGPFSDTGPQKDVVSFDRDASGRVTAVTMWVDETTSYVTKVYYDDADERVRVSSDLTATKSQKRDFTYTKVGLLESTKEYHGAGIVYTTTNTYNAAGWLTNVADPRGFNLKFAYDDLGRETRRWKNTSSDEITTTYLTRSVGGQPTDTDGTIAQTSNAEGGPIDYSSDLLGRPTSISSVGGTTSYVYADATGQLAAMTTPASATPTTYQYYPTTDASAGLLQSQSDPVTGLTTTFTYDTLGRPIARASGSNLRIDRTYEPDTGRIDTQSASKGTLTYARFALTYNRVGAVNHREEWLWDAGTTNPASSAGAYAGSGPWDYTYDGAGRMLSATGPFPTNYPATPAAATYATKTVSYAYDGQGNRTQMMVGSTTISWTTDPQGWITGSDGGTPGTTSDDLTYTYDPAGELTEIAKGATTIETFAYDAWGRTTSATAAGAAGAIDYGLDALGRTIFRTEGSGRTDLAYVGSSEDLAKETPVGGTSTTYAFTPGGLLASKTSSVTQMAIGDLHGDVVGSITKSGTDLSSATWYSPYGEQAPMEAATGRLGYQGDITDPDTGAVDMLTRQYLPELGRFTTRDILFGHPRDPMTLNQFAYAVGNPVSFTDPTGLRPGELSDPPVTQHHLSDWYSETANESEGAGGSGGIEEGSDAWVSYCLNSPNPASCFGYTRIYTPEVTFAEDGFWHGLGYWWMSATARGWYEGPGKGVHLVVGGGGVGVAAGGVEVVDTSVVRALRDAFSGRSGGGGVAHYLSSQIAVQGKGYSVGVEIDESLIRKLLGRQKGITIVYSSEANLAGGRQGRVGIEVKVDIDHQGVPIGGALAPALVWAAVKAYQVYQCAVTQGAVCPVGA